DVQLVVGVVNRRRDVKRLLGHVHHSLAELGCRVRAAVPPAARAPAGRALRPKQKRPRGRLAACRGERSETSRGTTLIRRRLTAAALGRYSRCPRRRPAAGRCISSYPGAVTGASVRNGPPGAAY